MILPLVLGAALFDPLPFSSAELHRYTTPEAGAAAERTTSSEKVGWDAGTLKDDETGASLTLRLVRPTTPSFTYRVNLATTSVWSAATDTGGTLHKSLARATLLGYDAAYKILDRLVLGAGADLRRIETDPGTDSAWALNHGAFRTAMLVKGEDFEAGLAQFVYTWTRIRGEDDHRQYVREVLLHGRARASASLWAGAFVQDDPLPASTLATVSSRRVYGLTVESAPPPGEGWSYVGAYTFQPAFDDATGYDIDRHGARLQLACSGASGWSYGLSLQGSYGHTSDAHVQIPAALGTTDRASYTASGFGFGLFLATNHL